MNEKTRGRAKKLSEPRLPVLGDFPRLTTAVAAWVAKRRDVAAFQVSLSTLPGTACYVLAVDMAMIVEETPNQKLGWRINIALEMETSRRGLDRWLNVTFQDGLAKAKRIATDRLEGMCHV